MKLYFDHILVHKFFLKKKYLPKKTIDKREICGLTIFHLKNNLIRCLKSFYNLINLKKNPGLLVKYCRYICFITL